MTGGLGSIGLEIAGHLAAHGAKHLVLTSRRAPSDAAQQRIDALGEQHGCEFRVVAADVADAHDVARLLATVQTELPPLAGIVHAAGEIGTTPLSNLDDAEVDRVFAGKVWGAWHLSEAAADLDLDFFISTSSIASVWGGFGQTAYGAANAFLDGLAWRLRKQGISGISVNFGPWSAGMADAESRARLDKRGVKTLSPADALAGLADVVAASSAEGAAQGVVARIDWARFLPLYEQAGRRGFLAELEREVPDMASAPTASGKTPFVEGLTNAPVQQRKKLLTDYLRDAVAEVTRVDAAEIREDAGFFDLGMDSLMAVELRRRIEQGVGREIPVTLVMDHPRLSDAAGYLLGEVLGLSEQASDKSGTAQASAVATRTDEPIAIVAVSCRFPGAPDPEAFWEVLAGGVDAIREVPEDRFDIDEFYDPDPETPGKTYTRFSKSSTESIDSIPNSSASPHARRSGSSRNSGWCSKRHGRVSKGPGTRRPLCVAAEPASSWGWAPTSTRICCPPSRSTRSSPTSSPATRSTPSPVGLPSRWDSKDRRWRSTPHAAPHWWHVHQACQALRASGDCDLAWPAASTSCSARRHGHRSHPARGCSRRRAVQDVRRVRRRVRARRGLRVVVLKRLSRRGA